MSKSLDDMLSGEAEDAPEIETVEVETPEAPPSDEGNVTTTIPVVEPVRDENGRFASTKGVEDPVPPTDKLPQDEYKALREEREKRQRLEAEIEALKQQFQQPQEPPAPPPSLWEDENAWGGQLVNTAVTQATVQARLDMSEMMMRQSEPEFSEKWQDMNQFLVQNPALIERFRNEPHPWNAAYQAYKNYSTMQELGATDLNSLRDKIREELMAEMAQQVPVKPRVPPTLTTERNVGNRSGPAWSGPKPLTDLLG